MPCVLPAKKLIACSIDRAPPYSNGPKNSLFDPKLMLPSDWTAAPNDEFEPTCIALATIAACDPNDTPDPIVRVPPSTIEEEER